MLLVYEYVRYVIDMALMCTFTEMINIIPSGALQQSDSVACFQPGPFSKNVIDPSDTSYTIQRINRKQKSNTCEINKQRPTESQTGCLHMAPDKNLSPIHTTRSDGPRVLPDGSVIHYPVERAHSEMNKRHNVSPLTLTCVYHII